MFQSTSIINVYGYKMTILDSAHFCNFKRQLCHYTQHTKQLSFYYSYIFMHNLPIPVLSELSFLSKIIPSQETNAPSLVILSLQLFLFLNYTLSPILWEIVTFLATSGNMKKYFALNSVRYFFKEDIFPHIVQVLGKMPS